MRLARAGKISALLSALVISSAGSAAADIIPISQNWTIRARASALDRPESDFDEQSKTGSTWVSFDEEVLATAATSRFEGSGYSRLVSILGDRSIRLRGFASATGNGEETTGNAGYDISLTFQVSTEAVWKLFLSTGPAGFSDVGLRADGVHLFPEGELSTVTLRPGVLYDAILNASGIEWQESITGSLVLVQVPEPSTIALLSVGAFSFLFLRYRPISYRDHPRGMFYPAPRTRKRGSASQRGHPSSESGGPTSSSVPRQLCSA